MACFVRSSNTINTSCPFLAHSSAIVIPEKGEIYFNDVVSLAPALIIVVNFKQSLDCNKLIIRAREESFCPIET